MEDLFEIPGVMKLLYVIALIVVGMDIWVWRAVA